MMIYTFTFHYGSIQIHKIILSLAYLISFTFHYGSIQISKTHIYSYAQHFLHSTMVLFKLEKGIVDTFLFIFTFHYGSIQIAQRKISGKCEFDFTFHYGSIQICIHS